MPLPLRLLSKFKSSGCAVAPTVLDFFGLPVPPDMQGVPLKSRMLDDTPVREGGLCKCSRSLGVKYQASSPIFTDGAHGATVNVTDGR